LLSLEPAVSCSVYFNFLLMLPNKESTDDDDNADDDDYDVFLQA